MRSVQMVAAGAPTVAIYARISLDRHDGEGVARQLADCREIAAQRWPGAEVVEYVDNDISAFRAKRRPEYERLLADLHGGRLGAVVAYHPDRIYRRMADLVTFIAAVQAAGADVATVRAGDLDLSTATGRMIAKIIGSIAEGESERIGERVARAKAGRAVQGRPAGGGHRPFGYTADRTALVDEEADELRRSAAAILAGRSWAAEVARLNDAGVRNTTGRQWHVAQLRRVLTSPHVVGLRAYKGEIVGDAVWPAIIDRGTWEILRADVAARRLGPRGRPSRHLLTGLLECSGCGRTLWANVARSGRFDYRCSPAATTTGKGCGTVSISAQPIEGHVVATVGGWFRSPEFVATFDAYLSYGDAGDLDARVELDELDRREVVLAQRWASGAMSDEAHDAAVAVLAQRRAELEARTIATGPRRVPGITAADVAATWDEDLPVADRREVIRLIAVTPIVVQPGLDDAGGRIPVEERVDVRPAFER